MSCLSVVHVHVRYLLLPKWCERQRIAEAAKKRVKLARQVVLWRVAAEAMPDALVASGEPMENCGRV